MRLAIRLGKKNFPEYLYHVSTVHKMIVWFRGNIINMKNSPFDKIEIEKSFRFSSILALDLTKHSIGHFY